MSNLFKTIVFNRFPADKKLFCRILDNAAESDSDIMTALHLEPKMYDRIYFTMTDREVLSIARRRNDLSLTDIFPECDAAFSYPGRYIVLHIPAMVLKLAKIPLRPDDYDGKVLFTMHLFGCLFHELGHACHAAKVVADTMGAILAGHKPPVFDLKESEEEAEMFEANLGQRFGQYLVDNDISWKLLADHLFDWQKLGPIFMGPRAYSVR